MNYLVTNIGRKGTLVLFVFLTVAVIEVSKGVTPTFADFALYVVGVFAGANVFEHFAKRPK